MDTLSSRPRRRYAILVLIAAIATAVVGTLATTWRERIDANEHEWFIARLNALIPAERHDNDLYSDRIYVSDRDFLGTASPLPVYRARKDGRPIGAILSTIAPDGYGGPIELLIAVDYAGVLLSVDVIRHSETQGIGDGFLPYRSSWLRSLEGRSIDNPSPEKWTIRKEGGAFEQFTGASITPRAILKAVRNALDYYARHRDGLFNTASEHSPKSKR